MRDDECVQFLQWALPRLRMRWPGFRKVRGQVCKRISRRLADLGIDRISDYRDYLARHDEEWGVLDKLCVVTISRFYRDRQVHRILEHEVLPDLARRLLHQGEEYLKVWSIGCGSGEEPFTISLIWRLQLQSKFPGLSLRLLASDSNPAMGQRVADARYSESSVKTLPPGWRDTAFIRQAKSYCLKTEFSSGIEFVQQDIRETIPDECFELVLCRNLVFTYFETDLQRSILERISSVLKPGGVLVIGVHERLPELIGGFSQWSAGLPVYRKTG